MILSKSELIALAVVLVVIIGLLSYTVFRQATGIDTRLGLLQIQCSDYEQRIVELEAKAH